MEYIIGIEILFISAFGLYGIIDIIKQLKK